LIDPAQNGVVVAAHEEEGGGRVPRGE